MSEMLNGPLWNKDHDDDAASDPKTGGLDRPGGDDDGDESGDS